MNKKQQAIALLVAGIALTLAPFGLLWVLTRLFPPWADPPESN